jgi:hypothetical protein
MKSLIAALALFLTPAAALAKEAPPPPPKPLLSPVVVCLVEGINPTVVCYDKEGRKSWIA